MVYVDTPRWRLGRMKMCHMMGDTPEELHRMANAIKVSRRHFQGDHYDICKARRARALMLGAQEATSRDLVRIRHRWRRVGWVA